MKKHLMLQASMRRISLDQSLKNNYWFVLYICYWKIMPVTSSVGKYIVKSMCQTLSTLYIVKSKSCVVLFLNWIFCNKRRYVLYELYMVMWQGKYAGETRVDSAKTEPARETILLYGVKKQKHSICHNNQTDIELKPTR
jgi:hypothetical protein